MDDDGAVIQKDPAAVGSALLMQRQDVFFFQSFRDGINNRFDLGSALSGTNDEIVCEATNALGI